MSRSSRRSKVTVSAAGSRAGSGTGLAPERAGNPAVMIDRLAVQADECGLTRELLAGGGDCVCVELAEAPV